MIISLTNKQIISYFVWIFVIIFSTLFFSHSLHFSVSFVLYLYNILVSIFGIYYTYKNNNIAIFSPIFLVIYFSIFYYTFMGLFSLSSLNKIVYLIPIGNDDFLLKTTSIIVMCFVIMLLPFVIKCFSHDNKKLDIKFFERSFDVKKVCKYLYYSFPIIIILYVLLCFATGFTPISAILNPTEFRNASGRDIANLVFMIYRPLFTLNLCLTIQLVLLKNIKTKTFRLYLMLFSIYCLFWAIFSGGRGWLVSYLVYFAVFYCFKPKVKVNLQNIIKISICVLLLGLFIGAYGTYRNYRTQLSQGVIRPKSLLSPIEKILFRMDTYSMCMNFFNHMNNEYESLLNYSGQLKTLVTGQFTMLIPRRLYPNKIDDMHGEITKMVDPKVYYGGVHLVYGGISSMFFEGGLLWLFFNYFIIGIIVMFLQFYAKHMFKNELFLLFYILILFDILGMLFSRGLINEANTLYIFIKILIYFLIMKNVSINCKYNNYVKGSR